MSAGNPSRRWRQYSADFLDKKFAYCDRAAILHVMKILKALGMGLLVGGAGVSAFADSQKVVDIQSVQNAIAREHAEWHAQENWVSRLSHEELQRMLGLQRGPQGNLDYDSIRPLIDTAPKMLDWRNYNGINWLGPVMNQGNCGSCVAFATVATLEARTSVSAGLPWLHPTFSPQYLFACGGGGCESGWMPDSAADFLERNGIPDEACMPYTSGSTGEDVSCTQKCSDSNSRVSKISGYSMPSSYGGNAEAVKAALKKGPLITTLFVYADFVTYAGGIYKHVTGSSLGGHAVSLVGFDDTKRAWLIRNSWGKEWGENGFGWVSYDDRSGIGADTWAMDIQSDSEILTVTSPSDREYVSGQYQLSAKTQGIKAQDLQFHVAGSDGRELGKYPCAKRSVEGGCAVPIDTTQMHEGRYEIYVESASSGKHSQVREFYVINSKPKMSISFTGASGTNLNAPLKDRPEFIVKTTSSPVPIQHLEFRVLDSGGKIINIKSNDQVLDEMKAGWRTTAVPNGSYKILFHGETTYMGTVYPVDSNSYSVTVKN